MPCGFQFQVCYNKTTEYHLAEKSKHVKYLTTSKLVSFDLENMCTNILVDLTVNLTGNKLKEANIDDNYVWI